MNILAREYSAISKPGYTYSFKSKKASLIKLKEMNVDYHQKVDVMKSLMAFYRKKYDLEYTIGRLNQASPKFSYFSLTPSSLKEIKLKFVIIFDHSQPSFEICLSGQNKNIRKKYWEIFKGSDWDKYHLAEDIDNSLQIVYHTLITDPDFYNQANLIQWIVKEAQVFIDEVEQVLV